MATTLRAPFLALGFIAVACGGAEFTSNNGGIDPRTQDSGGPNGNGDSGTNPGGNDVCPPTPTMVANDTCTDRGAVCEYGPDPRVTCNTRYTCETVRQRWSVLTPSSPPACPTPKAQTGDACPADPQKEKGTHACTNAGQTCAYPSGSFCACAFTNTGQMWVCDVPADSRCPSPRPRIGTTCDAAKFTAPCDYGACSKVPDGVTLQCQSGRWQTVLAKCP